MDSWVGKTCPYCQTPLKPGAVVVLCRACGMPHHRECWEENGRCTTYGCSGLPVDEPALLICPRCRAANAPGHQFCGQCGAALMPVLSPRSQTPLSPGQQVREQNWSSPPPVPSVQGIGRNHLNIRWVLLGLAGIVALLIISIRMLTNYHPVSINPVDGAEMVQVPAGEFIMGSPPGVGLADEHPQHSIYLDSYYLYKNDVTVAQYRKFCAATGCAMPAAPPWDWHDNHPIVNVTWFDAQAYAAWAGVALPTEAEWEKAARGTHGRQYPWGNNWDGAKCVNFVNPYGYPASTQPVGSRPAGASPYGALDMAGNVWQWCADWYRPDYYTVSQNSNPTGPDKGDSRVLRGGCWNLNIPDNFRTTLRGGRYPARSDSHCGFRCVSRTSVP